jgi:hypothetical protein
MGDNEKLAYWEQRGAEYKERSMEWLAHALFAPDLGAMMQLFAQEGYTLGRYSKEIHQKILKAYIDGKTSLQHVRLFFSRLGGSFLTNLEETECVWTRLAWIETRMSIYPNTMEEFLLKFCRIYNLVRCLATEFNMPVNPDKRFSVGFDPARPLDGARNQGAWMLYYCMASYFPDRRLTIDELSRDQYLAPEILEFWANSGFLDNSGNGHINVARLDHVAQAMQEHDLADQNAHRQAFQNHVDQLADQLAMAGMMLGGD